MNGREQKYRTLATLLVASAVCVLSSCASSAPEAESPSADAKISDSALLDDSSKVGATDVSDSTAFADLAKGENESTPVVEGKESDGETFYNSIGGESLRRVAITLYSDKSFTKKLMEKNPELKGVQKLGAEQKVFFDMDSARPNPTYLTKDLLNRYAAPLAEKISTASAKKGIAKTSATVNKGESLQNVSMRLYGTSRYWTELFLVNRDKIQNYDRVPAGIEIVAFSHPASGVAQATHKKAPAVLAEITEDRQTGAPKRKNPKPKQQVQVAKSIPAVTSPPKSLEPMPIQPTPVQPPPPAPVAIQAPPPPDPIPETPPMQMEVPGPTPTKVEPADSTSANSNLRRILYMVLILSIGGGAYYFTRSPKRPKVDMLDLNADAAIRPKLPTKDSQKHNIG